MRILVVFSQGAAVEVVLQAHIGACLMNFLLKMMNSVLKS